MSAITDAHEVKTAPTTLDDNKCGICEKDDFSHFRGSTVSWPNHISGHAHRVCYAKISKFEKALQEKIKKVYKKVEEQNLGRQKVIAQVMHNCGGETIDSYIKKSGEDALIAILNKLKI
jgi:hypothetical protein